MNNLLKFFAFTVMLTQFVQAGRYYDNEHGRFIERDPLGYIDGMSLYNAYFAEKFTVDPYGTTINDKNKKPKRGQLKQFLEKDIKDANDAKDGCILGRIIQGFGSPKCIDQDCDGTCPKEPVRTHLKDEIEWAEHLKEWVLMKYYVLSCVCKKGCNP